MREVLLMCWRDTGHPQGGGSELYLERVGRYLAERGIRVTYRTARYRGSVRDEIRDGVRFSRGGGRLTVYPRALAELWLGRRGIGPLAGVDPDVVIDTQNGVPFFARFATPAPVAVLVHHVHREQWPVAGRLLGRFGWWIESSLSPRVHRGHQYLTVSLPSAEELASIVGDSDRIAVVRNGSDTPTSATTASSRAADPTLTVLSRLVPHKRIEDALEVAATLRRQIPELRVDVIGGGWWEPNLRECARTLGIEDAVTFHGHVDEDAKHRLLARSWVHVLPSRKEGWGLAVIEAGHHGVPTVGYRSSRGLTDSIVDGVTGVLVGGSERGAADVLALTAAVAELLDDSELRSVMGDKARARAAEFSWDSTGAGVEAVLEDVIAGRRRGGIVGRR